MMNRTDKEQLVKDIRKSIEDADAVFLTNLIGIPSNDSVALRKVVRDAGGKVIISRNTLLKKAAQGTKSEKLLANLKGPSAIALSYKDAPAVAKAIYDASKNFEVIQIKGGLLSGKELSAKDVESLAKLPSRDQMLATLLATFNAPVSAFVRCLDAIREKKQSDA